MLRTIVARGSSLIPSSSSSFRPTLLTSSSSLITRHYANPHSTTQHQAAHSSPAEQAHHHDKATSHGHDAHGKEVDSHGNAHHSEHSDHHDADHHHDHHHISHDNAPYGILFGEVYEGKRKIPAWEWIYYAGFTGAVIAFIYVFRDFDERRIETWAKRTYADAVEHSRRTDAQGIASESEKGH